MHGKSYGLDLQQLSYHSRKPLTVINSTWDVADLILRVSLLMFFCS